jgi:pimeloyl-ACP methyl ester carboxylesterase
MSDPVLQLDEQLRAPLAALGGARPSAPAWFELAVAQAPERSSVEVDGAAIELLAWGERGRPGLLFVHGGMAHAGWFDHIAPFFARTHRVAALSLSGCGRSGWRERYEVAQFAREMAAAAVAAGLHAAGPPVYVAHSFGSRPLLHAAADPALAPRLAIVLDSALALPGAPLPAGRAREARPHRVYPSLEAALARFRLMPYQPCENLFILDHIARQSLHRVQDDAGAQGWTWRFDPFLFPKVSGAEPEATEAALKAALCPVAVLYGESSAVVRPDNLARTRAARPDAVYAAVPDAAHHLFLDQPLATVAGLRALLACLAP